VGGGAAGFLPSARDIQVFPKGVDMAREGAIPAGSLANHEFYSKYVIWEPSAPEKLQPVF